MSITGVKVDLLGQDGNAFYILARVLKTMRREGVSAAVIEEYQQEATSGDYDHLLQTTIKYCEVV